MRLPFVLRSTYDAGITAATTAAALAGQSALAEAVSAERKETAMLLAERDARLIEERKQYAVDLERERADRRDLLARFTQLRVMGAQDTPSPMQAPPAKAADALAELCVDVCGADQRKLAMMLRQLAEDRANERDEGEILNEILTGRVVSYEIGLPA